jgi:hypothetical protein
MLNMLVAVMSDTYARVMKDIKPMDYYELLHMILEQEEILIWNRKIKEKKYLHFVQYLEKQEKVEWEGQAGGNNNSKNNVSVSSEDFKKMFDTLYDTMTIM